MIRGRIENARRLESEWRGFAEGSTEATPKILAMVNSQTNADNAEIWECILQLYRGMSALAKVTLETKSEHSVAIQGLRGEFSRIAEAARKRDASQPYIR